MVNKLRVLLTVQHKDIQLKEDCSFLYRTLGVSSLDLQRSVRRIGICSSTGGKGFRRKHLVCIQWFGCNIMPFCLCSKVFIPCAIIAKVLSFRDGSVAFIGSENEIGIPFRTKHVTS